MSFKYREILKALLKSINDSGFTALSGKRRSGKSSLLKEIQNELEKQKIRVFYLDLKNPKNLMKLNENHDYISEILGTSYKDKVLVIIDDIDLLINPETLIESIKSRYLDFVNVIVSYTNKEELNKLFDKKNYFNLTSLSFSEFLTFKGFEGLVEPNDGFFKKEEIKPRTMTQLMVLFNEFIKYGAYPEVVLSENSSDKKDMLSDFINTLIQKDIQKEGIKDISKVYQLLKLLAEKSGELLNSNECAKNLDVSITAVENYLKVLENLSIITRIKPFFAKYDKELKKMPIVYFNDLGVRNSVLGMFNSIEDRFDKENYFNNILFKLLSDKQDINSIKFWRTQSRHEVDFIIDEKIAIGSKFNPRLLKENKYKKFKELYPEIKLYFAGYKGNTNETLSVFDFV